MAKHPVRFHASELARALKVAQQAGLTIARVEIEPSSKIVLHMPDSVPGHDAPDPVLEAVRKRSPSVGQSA